jgi:hypothetical protein
VMVDVPEMCTIGLRIIAMLSFFVSFLVCVYIK